MDKKELNEKIELLRSIGKLKKGILKRNEDEALNKQNLYQIHSEQFQPIIKAIKQEPEPIVKAIKEKPIYNVNIDDGIDRKFLIEKEQFPLPSEIMFAFHNASTNEEKQEVFAKITSMETTLLGLQRSLGGKKRAANNQQKELIDFQLQQISLYKERLRLVKQGISLIHSQEGSGINLEFLKLLTKDLISHGLDRKMKKVVLTVLQGLLRSGVIDESYYAKYIAQYLSS
jgi:Mg2+ and Co2+ transporter CorA